MYVYSISPTMTDTTAPSNPLNWIRDDYDHIEKPFKNDLLQRKPLAIHLTSYIDRLQVGAVLALDARWGEGKTWFVKNWKDYLEQTDIPHKTIYINAFSQDYIDDPFLLIAAEIRNTISGDETLKKKLTTKIMAVGKALAPSFYKGSVSTGAKWLMGINDGADKLEQLQEKLVDATSDEIGLWIEKQIKEHENNKNAIAEFKTVLKEVAQAQEQPIVIMVDELDRCNPLFSVRLIERIKHFFDIPNIVFVLVTDKTQLQATICHQFGYSPKIGKQYLEKFIDVTIELTPDLVSKDAYLHFVTETLKAMNFSQDAITALRIDIVIYAVAMRLSIREIKNKLHRFILYYFDKNTEKCRILLFKIFCSEYPTFKIPHDIVKMHQIALYRLLDPIVRRMNPIGLILQSDSPINSHNSNTQSESIDDFLYKPIEVINLMANQPQTLNYLKSHFQNQFELNEDTFKWTTLYRMLNLIEQEAEDPNLSSITNAIQAIVPYSEDIGHNYQLYEKMNLSWEKYLATGFYK